MKFFKFIKDSKGFSLAEIMVAVGLMGGLSLAMMKLMENQNANQKGIEDKANITEIASEIYTMLNRQESCTATFTDSYPGKQINDLYLKTEDFTNNKPFVSLNGRYKNYPIAVTKMYLLTRAEETAKGLNYTGYGPDGSSTANLLMEFTKTSKAKSTGSNSITKIFSIKGKFYEMQILTGCDPQDLGEQCAEMQTKAGGESNALEAADLVKYPTSDGYPTVDSDTCNKYGGKALRATCYVYGKDMPLAECDAPDKYLK